ncbi:membrane-associated kinase regulator 1 [Tripterygium wilfordii]|uniref:Membrane-associated kinase regulator 1 n=1 Tax=Tripterygium wilfordii TaxID=458696 RepID=A0A7J7CS70_TRIWF|nr:probable membrane-associated kinase regulator 1 [Tripterygium wilfordii]KAF5736848.1 membrane-associated kinase regulator 1 [Tripterygium wilfordii]
MGRRRETDRLRSQTLPSSPSHSFSASPSSSSDFEFTVSLSPRKTCSTLCPADELFYKGQLLPLHLSPRISMVRTLLLASPSTSSSSDITTTASRDSASSNDSNSSFTSDLLAAECESSRPSSAAEDDELKRFNNSQHLNQQIKKSKYFSLARFSSVFKKDQKTRDPIDNVSGKSVKRISATAKEVIRKYLKKVKPLYEKLSQKQQQKMGGGTIHATSATANTVCLPMKLERSDKDPDLPFNNSRKESSSDMLSHSFSGNLWYPSRRSCVSSCPSSMRSSPSHSGVLCRTGYSGMGTGPVAVADSSSTEELQSAIQGAIAHCKNSMMNKNMVSIEI